jgi:hypothetical protein
MTAHLKVGMICILRNDPHLTVPSAERYNGEEVEIIHGLAWTEFADGSAGYTYDIRVPGGDEFCAFPHELIPKQPPTGLATVLEWFTAPAPREVDAA